MATTLPVHPAIGPDRTDRRAPPHPIPSERGPRSGWPIMTQTLAWPFDAARSLYARAVQAGLIERSLLANAKFEHALGTLERLSLGPWARRV